MSGQNPGLPLRINIMRTLVLLALAAMPAWAQNDGPITVFTTGGRTRTRDVSFEAGKGFFVKGRGQPIALDRLVSVQFQLEEARPPESHSVTVQAVLLNGDTVYGSIDSDSDSGLKLRTLFGTIRIRFEHLRSVTFLTTLAGRWDPNPDRSRGDLVRLQSGEEDVGVVRSIGPKKISFRSKILDESLNYRTARVCELHFQPMGGRTDFEPGPGLVAVTLLDGTSLRGNLVKINKSGIKLEPESDSLREAILPRPMVASLTFQNGTMVYLSDLDPVQVLESPYVGSAASVFPYQRDRSAGGDERPITLDGKRYTKGLGVHSFSELTYDADGRYRTFLAVVGLDESSRGGGSVVFRVIADGKEIFDSGLLVGRDWQDRLEGKAGAQELRLKIEGVRKLTLRVECGPDDDVLDRAAWGDAKLIR